MAVGICCNCKEKVFFEDGIFFGEDGDKLVGLFCPKCYECNNSWYYEDEEDYDDNY